MKQYKSIEQQQVSISSSQVVNWLDYARVRSSVRPLEIAYKKARTVLLGPHMRVQFENARTVRYQTLEVMYMERTCLAAQSTETYAALVPNGTDWRATVFIELESRLERERWLPQLSHAAHDLYIEVAGAPRVFVNANSDLEDGHWARSSAVHFACFALTQSQRIAVLSGASVRLGCVYPAYAYSVAIDTDTLELIASDLKRMVPFARTGVALPACQADC
jgi:hypothetical protein